MNSNKLIAPDVTLGKDVVLSSFINLYGCRIDDDTKIGAFVEIQKNAFIGKRCKISSHTFICEGVKIEDDVFIGHGVIFINDKYPMAITESGELQTWEDWEVVPTVIKQGVSIGSNSTLMCGITVGTGSIIGAGSVVIHDVQDKVIVAGNPAKIIRKINI